MKNKTPFLVAPPKNSPSSSSPSTLAITGEPVENRPTRLLLGLYLYLHSVRGELPPIASTTRHPPCSIRYLDEYRGLKNRDTFSLNYSVSKPLNNNAAFSHANAYTRTHLDALTYTSRKPGCCLSPRFAQK